MLGWGPWLARRCRWRYGLSHAAPALILLVVFGRFQIANGFYLGLGWLGPHGDCKTILDAGGATWPMIKLDCWPAGSDLLYGIRSIEASTLLNSVLPKPVRHVQGHLLPIYCIGSIVLWLM